MVVVLPDSVGTDETVDGSTRYGEVELIDGNLVAERLVTPVNSRAFMEFCLVQTDDGRA